MWSQKICKFSALASNFKSLSRSLEHFFLTVGQKSFGNKIPYIYFLYFRFENGYFPGDIFNNRSLWQQAKCRKRQKRQTGGQLLLFTKCVTLLYKNPTEIPVTHWIYTFRMQHNGIKLILKSHVKNQNFNAPSLISSKDISKSFLKMA